MIHGVLNVYKEKGYTSHDVVAKLRGIVKQKKIGIPEPLIRCRRSTSGLLWESNKAL